MRQRSYFGEHAACARCGQDIEFHGARNWLDRGNGRKCGPYKGRDGEVVQERYTKLHYPYRPQRRMGSVFKWESGWYYQIDLATPVGPFLRKQDAVQDARERA